MLHALSAVRPGILLVGAGVVVGLYALHAHEPRTLVPPQPTAPKVVAFVPPVSVPPSLDAEEEDDEEDEEIGEEIEEEIALHGLDPFDDASQFAMVFTVDGTAYLRLSTTDRADDRGPAELIYEGESMAAVATVTKSAMPTELQSWMGKTVLVDGSCRARVVGFAEVSRVAGEPPGSDAYYYSDPEDRPEEKPEWNLENVVEANVTLAARLDGCTDGTWARSTEHAPAIVARVTEAPDLEQKALAQLLAEADADDTTKQAWTDMGGEGDWRDDADVDVTTFVHPESGESWIFAQASTGGGGCGSPTASAMAAYKVGDDGKVRKVTNLDHAFSTIRGVVDIDGDGEPELLLGEGDATELVDLTGESRDSISIDYHSYGCGC
jgi:hypothetical protein